jgi:hypothetical protein
MTAAWLARRRPYPAYRKPASPVKLPGTISASPFRVLHRLGLATTFEPAGSPFARIAQHWGHVRYCGALQARGGSLALTANAASAVVHRHKAVQSEQLGVGLGLVVAQHIMESENHGWRFDAIDAESALGEHSLGGPRPVGVEYQEGTKKRPDYFLLGRKISGPRAFKAVVLECKGTHQKADHSVKQLADACLQVNAVLVGGRPRRGLMVASGLTGPRITSYVLDPEDEDDLWSGSDEELASLLDAEPVPPSGQLRPASPEELEAQERALPDYADDNTESEQQQSEDRALPMVYDLPNAWLMSVLARTEAAALAAYAGNTGAAADYAPARSASSADGDREMGAATSTLRLTGDLALEGIRLRAPLGGGRAVEFFRGLESSLYRDLDEGRVSDYFGKMDNIYAPWADQAASFGDAVSLCPDGSALVMRLVDD